jgi:hypothetical protein
MPQPSPTAAAPRSLAAADPARHLAPGPAESAAERVVHPRAYVRPAVIPPEGILIRYVFGTWGRCPECGSEHWRVEGVNGRTQYRRCQGGHTWKSAALAAEVDRGDIVTRIEVL